MKCDNCGSKLLVPRTTISTVTYESAVVTHSTVCQSCGYEKGEIDQTSVVML
jgi:C4-type Zn-finger protein